MDMTQNPGPHTRVIQVGRRHRRVNATGAAAVSVEEAYCGGGSVRAGAGEIRERVPAVVRPGEGPAPDTNLVAIPTTEVHRLPGAAATKQPEGLGVLHGIG